MKQTTIMLLILSSAAVWAAEGKTIRMKVEGMTCGMCESKIKSSLAPFCAHVTVDREKGEALCECKKGTTDEQVVSEVNKIGFKASVAK